MEKCRKKRFTLVHNDTLGTVQDVGVNKASHHSFSVKAVVSSWKHRNQDAMSRRQVPFRELEFLRIYYIKLLKPDLYVC